MTTTLYEHVDLHKDNLPNTDVENIKNCINKNNFSKSNTYFKEYNNKQFTDPYLECDIYIINKDNNKYHVYQKEYLENKCDKIQESYVCSFDHNEKSTDIPSDMKNDTNISNGKFYHRLSSWKNFEYDCVNTILSNGKNAILYNSTTFYGKYNNSDSNFKECDLNCKGRGCTSLGNNPRSIFRYVDPNNPNDIYDDTYLKYNCSKLKDNKYICKFNNNNIKKIDKSIINPRKKIIIPK